MTTELPSLPDLGKARLRQLIAYLRVLPSEQFDFGVVIEERACGTVGCAMGHCAILFPELVRQDWEWFDVRTKSNRSSNYRTVASELFGMCIQETNIFSPLGQRLVHDKLPECRRKSTPSQVAAMLETFIELTETEVRA